MVRHGVRVSRPRPVTPGDILAAARAFVDDDARRVWVFVTDDGTEHTTPPEGVPFRARRVIPEDARE